ncbi:MAG: vanadium-dependent haloperoxidase [Cyanobacteria bacterium P01_F01_bin.53]
MESRKKRALEGRIAAAKLAYDRPHPKHIANGEELKYRFGNDNEPPERQGQASHLANYTKGLPHEHSDGLVCVPADYQQFIQGIDSGDPRDFQDTPLGPKELQNVGNKNDCDGAHWKSLYTQTIDKDKRVKEKASNQKVQGVAVRAWESAGAGLVFDLEGPDAQSVTMPPAPTFDSAEFAAEVAEVYEMALLRDVPFAQFDGHAKVKASIDRLNALDWFNGAPIKPLTAEARARRRDKLTTQNVFRGNSVGDEVGPYISQFLCLGTPELGDDPMTRSTNVLDGFVSYGAMRFDNKVRIAEPRDYMTSWEWWLDVQNGADLRGTEGYETKDSFGNKKYRFIATPRDLATYVHYDALYQAYFNACLFMLSAQVPFDPGIPYQGQDTLDHQQGFAHFGGPHILSLVTEVATRALKAVRYQKFNIHRRLRPEAVGGRIHKRRSSSSPASLAAIDNLSKHIHPTLKEIARHNQEQNKYYLNKLGVGGSSEFGSAEDVLLLPMAFAEGSPMHPSYGAGHATVAGACVTILKAFFDHGYVLPKPYVFTANGSQLDPINNDQLDLTVEGELNKLASNIAIGRDWAGVHYFTDYYESIRMGEQIAIGILEEQKLTYGENFSMTVPLFSGGSVRI